jgi:hypothetical protein
MKRLRTLCTLFLVTLGVACSLAPQRPVTREILMQTRIYTSYVIEESPEEVVDALNKNGEAVLAVKRSIRGVDYPMHLKLLATSEGLEVLEYDR